MSLLLTGARVVRALDPPHVEAADVLVAGDRIAAVGPIADTSDVARGATRLDCSGCLVVPGSVCAHTHVYSALARGMPFRLEPPRTFVETLRRVWWRLDRALDPASIRASARVGAMEALLAGTTTLVDHHASPAAIDGSLDLVAEAFAELGIRSAVSYEVTDRDGPERARAGVAENVRFARRAALRDLPLARSIIGAHASFTLSDETLDACVEAAAATGTGIHVHVAEDAADEADAERRFGCRVVERLSDRGALTDRSLLAHAVHLDADEAAAVRASGATVAHNPRSNMNNAVGRAPLARLGDRVALGTDGIGGDMFEESRLAFLRAREDEGLDPAPGWPLARLSAGAQFAGRLFDEPLLGRIDEGAPADLVVLDYAAPTPVSAETLAGHWQFGLSGRAVRDVVVAGRLVVVGGRLTIVDQDALAAEARLEARRLWQRLDAIDVHPFDPAEVPR